MPYLLDSVCTIIGVFYKYAKRHGDSSTLNRREMKRLIRKEFAQVIENPRDPKTVELTFQMLDTNGDGLVDFNEYLLLMFKVAKACYSQLKPREGLLQREEAGKAPHRGEPQRHERDNLQVWDEARKERNIREREDSRQTYFHPNEATERSQERRHLREPVAQMDDRSHQAQDHHERDRPSHEPQELEDGQTYEYEQQAPNTHREAHDFEPQRTEARYHQVRQREPPAEEDHQHQSQDLLPRNEKERQHPSHDPQSWEGNERQHQEVRNRRRGDYAKDLETQHGVRSQDIRGDNADEQLDQIRNREPLDEYDSLPREDKRRPQIADPEWEQRRSQRHETETRERARTNDSEWREQSRTGQQQSAPQAREAEHKANQRNEPQIPKDQQSTAQDARAGGEPEASQPVEREHAQEQSGTQEKPEAQDVTQEGDGDHPVPTELEEGNGGSPRAREPQPLLDEEEENQPDTEGPQHGAEKIPESLDASQDKPSFLCEKVPPVCNPLYEYLLAQKKVEEP
ncbi:trichohyalin-like [Sceloporus undulatus]|uniref:trichohyalin-like n=1 Tax=Sceloporus undulatus TaxID=8520 RepID=UPI001C4BA8D4|nr:trichohyalin-like [Sceloporus undulatus]